ncbi:MAG: hypothetical protein OXS32_06835 [Verrucomicrobiales bacterium]|nr:hypothetical protein [Verrucomicrobiales bacterium]
MQIVSAIIALAKAVPVLERLFLSVADGIREAKAKSRLEAKLDHIDAAMRLHGLPDGSRVQQHQAFDSAPRVPESGVQRAELYEGRIKDNRRT